MWFLSEYEVHTDKKRGTKDTRNPWFLLQYELQPIEIMHKVARISCEYRACLHTYFFFMHLHENRLFSLCIWIRIVVENQTIIAMRAQCCCELCTNACKSHTNTTRARVWFSQHLNFRLNHGDFPWFVLVDRSGWKWWLWRRARASAGGRDPVRMDTIRGRGSDAGVWAQCQLWWWDFDTGPSRTATWCPTCNLPLGHQVFKGSNRPISRNIISI